MWCEVADDSVVVMKSRPLKTGNCLEGKTGTTCHLVGRGGDSMRERFRGQLADISGAPLIRPTASFSLREKGHAEVFSVDSSAACGL